MSDEIGFFILRCEDGRKWGYLKKSIAERRCEQLKADNLTFSLVQINGTDESRKAPRKTKTRYKKSEPGLYRIKTKDSEEEVRGWNVVQVQMQNLKQRGLAYKVYRWNEEKDSFQQLKKYCFRVRA